MPKAEKGTPKDIANRMKAKGLQRLRWYCQMCNKQCRDENGFKCHITSDSHLRQMKLFSQNACGMMDQFSREFEKTYLDALRRRHGTVKINANVVYQEVIRDKHHIHMNSTKWTTLSGFVQYLGKTGKCVVEETERGWDVQYIERDPFLLARQENAKKRAEAERLEEVKQGIMMEKQRMEAAKALDKAGGVLNMEASSIDTSKKVTSISLSSLSATSKSKKSAEAKTAVKSVLDVDDDDEEKDVHNNHPHAPNSANNEKKRIRDKQNTNTEEPHQHKKSKKSSSDTKTKSLRKDNWLHTGIIIKILSKKLSNGLYYKRKGIIDELIDDYTAQIEVLDSGPRQNDGGDIIRLDQEDLQTVVPSKIGKRVKIVNGEGRGCLASVVALDDKKCRADLKLVEDGRIIERVDYDDFSKAE